MLLFLLKCPKLLVKILKYFPYVLCVILDTFLEYAELGKYISINN